MGMFRAIEAEGATVDLTVDDGTAKITEVVVSNPADRARLFSGRIGGATLAESVVGAGATLSHAIAAPAQVVLDEAANWSVALSGRQ